MKYNNVAFHRITDVAYKVFYDSIDAQGRALIRVPLVSPSAAALHHVLINSGFG